MADWKTWLLYAALGSGGLVVVYYVLSGFLSSGINTYKQIYDDQYANLLKKLNTDVNTSTTLTPAQQQSITTEETILQNTAQNLANASNGLFDVAEEAVAVIGALAAIGIVIKFSPQIVNAIKIARGLKPSEMIDFYSVSYATMLGFADGLQAEGDPNGAASLIESAKTIFSTQDQPAIQQSITNLQNFINSGTVVGTDLIVAQEMMEALTDDLTIIPNLLATPLPLPIV